ncbi:MAG: hypothetical protein ABJP48_10500 [Erythrobacter sp.]
MNSKAILICLAGSVALSGCSTADKELFGHQDPTWGEANRATMAAQVINPNPEYDTLVPETSAERAANAIERYRSGQVEQPDRIATTDVGVDGPE